MIAMGILFMNIVLILMEIMKDMLGDADVVIHLAGVTDVAYTKPEEGTAKDRRITEVGVDGTRNIINYTKDSCRIIFPSTHVVYEGYKETKLDISETVRPVPELTYSTGKVQSEVDLVNSDKDYVILRLATVCGYSSDTMRLNIMPNLFSKIASQNGTIKLFSGGVQLKSLVPLVDVARSFNIIAENNSISREIFHCASEAMTVKEVANICKEFQPNLTITETDDEIPNLGYTISNKKLLATDFEFLYTVKDCIVVMVV